MGNIVLLDELTINKIAAGEVIERPASVIKEMVENSIDAGAKNITVEIKEGGISFIRITDDGSGIAEDDMEIAFERHSTSKIRNADDLNFIKTMGFRGEALASIAAIAKVEMVSKTEKEETGHKIVIEGGEVLEKEEIGTPVGTRITVEKLFFNTPVRYKFLKKNYTEAGYIEDAIKRIALVNPKVSFKLVSDNKTIIQTNGNGNLQDVIYSIYGKEIANELIDIDYTYEDMKVTGVVGKPIIARGNRTNQLFFVNNRYVKDKNLTAAAEQGYKGMIPVGRYGFAVLNIEMNPNKVDVNVHPAKLEVRFQDENAVFKAVYHSIKSGLMKSELVADVEDEEHTSKNDEGLKKMSEEANIKNDSIKANEYIKDEEKHMGFSGIFKRHENDSKDEEKSNTIEEIYNARNILKNYYDSKKENGEEKISNELEKDNDSKKTDEIDELGEGTKIQSEFLHSDENNEYAKENESKESDDVSKLENDIKLKLKQLQEMSDSVSSTSIEAVRKNIINSEEINKEIKLEDTKISSNTREINVTTVNNLIKEATQVLLSTKLEKNTDETQVVKENVNDTLKNGDEPTQIIDIKKENLSQETKVFDEEKENNTQNTIIVDKENEEKNPQNSEENVDNVSQNQSKNENNNEDEDAFAEIAEKLIKARLETSDNTQMIDTAKVREALKNSNFEALEKEIDLSTASPEFEEMYKKTFGIEPSYIRKEKEKEDTEKAEEDEKINASKDFDYANMNVFEEKEQYPEIKYKFIGIAFSTYIIIEIKDEMYIIDQHAAHERIMYEKVKENYYSDEEKDEQMLLLPDVITLTHKEMDIANENVDMFKKAGFSFEEFGENTIKLVSVPSMCEDLNTKQLFLDLLDEIDTVAVTARQEKEDKFIATVACKAAVKAKMKLDEKEVENLMTELLKLPNPFTCPHGRPTAIKMTKYDMERKFSRR